MRRRRLPGASFARCCLAPAGVLFCFLGALGVLGFPGSAAAAPAAPATALATKLSATGVSASGRERFDESLRRALAGGRYSVVPVDEATYELSADLLQVGPDTSFKLRLIDLRSARLVVERDARCTGCDELEAASRLQLAVESLLVSALEVPAGQSPTVAESGRSPRPASAWMRVLPWVGLLGVAGASAAVNAHYRCRESDGMADACTVPLIALTSVAVLSAGLAVGASMSLALDNSSAGERAPPRWAPWVILLSGAAAGASGIAILTEHGYGNKDVKALGYASIGAAAVVGVTAVGAIIKAPAGRGQMALSVSPASVALSGHF